MASPPRYPSPPIVGALVEMRRDPLALMMRVARHGDLVGISFPGLKAHLLAHPDYARHALVDNYRNYGKQTRGYQMLRIGLGDGLVTSEGDFWRRQRRIAQPAFHRRRIAAFAELMVNATRDMVDRWSAQKTSEIDIDKEMMALTLRIVGESLLSTDLSDDTDEVGSAVTTLLHGMMKRITLPVQIPLTIPTPMNRRLRSALDNLDAVIFRIIRERRTSEAGERDLLDMLIAARDEETGEAMTDQQLRDELITMVLAGHETTSNALTWTFGLLSRHPAVEEKLMAEIDTVLSDRDPTLDDLPQLAYTEAVIKESMRLYPPVWAVARSVTREDQIGGYTLPAGAIVFISPYVLHRDARFWPNPEGFRPERFIGDAAKDHHKHAYLPFIFGPRQCIGAGFAMLEAQLILATVLRRYALHLVAGQRIVPQAEVTLRPRYGMRMHL